MESLGENWIFKPVKKRLGGTARLKGSGEENQMCNCYLIPCFKNMRGERNETFSRLLLAAKEVALEMFHLDS